MDNENISSHNSSGTGGLFFQFLREKLASFSPRQRMLTIITIVALLGIPVTLVALQYQQNFRSKASEEDKVKLLQVTGNECASAPLVLSDQKPNSFCLQIEEINWR